MISVLWKWMGAMSDLVSRNVVFLSSKHCLVSNRSQLSKLLAILSESQTSFEPLNYWLYLSL